MTAPRLREQCRPPSPPDRRPPRRGGRPSSQTVSAAARPAGLARLAGARRGLLRSAGALAAAACLALSVSLALPATAEAQTPPTCTLNTGDLWCGVVTVETLRASGFYVGDGFSEVLDGGALSDKEFSVGTNSYTIDLVFVKPASSAETGKLTFSLTSALTATDKEKLVLHVGSASFAFSDRTPDASHHYLWTWTGTGLDWSSTSEVTLRLQLRPDSTDATLSGLAVNDGSTDLMLNPGFAPDEDTYTASVASTVAEVTVTPTTTDDGATIEYLNASNMTLADVGTDAGQQVALAVGDNVIKVQVTAEDGTTTRTYAVTVHRVSPTCTLNTGDLWCGVVTVGAFESSGSTTAYGFSSSVGHLSDTGFSVGTNPYTIDTTSVAAAATSGAGSLQFSLTSDLTAADEAKLVLHVGSAEFAFSAAFGPSGTNTWFLTQMYARFWNDLADHASA